MVQRLGTLTAFGNDISLVASLRKLERRQEVYRAWRVRPDAFVFHSYGVGGHHAVMVPLYRRTVRKAGFQGLIIGGEVARRVDASAGNAADRALSGEWWRQYAHEVAKWPDVAACYFMLYEVNATPEVLAAFQSPVPTGASGGVDQELAGQQGWGIWSALLPSAEQLTDTESLAVGNRAARDAY